MKDLEKFLAKLKQHRPELTPKIVPVLEGIHSIYKSSAWKSTTPKKKVEPEFVRVKPGPRHNEARENCYYLALIALASGDDWAREFFVDVGNYMGTTYTVMEKDYDSDNRLDALRDQYGGRRNIPQYVLEIEHPRYLEVQRPKQMTSKQGDIYERYLTKWGSKIDQMKEAVPHLLEHVKNRQAFFLKTGIQIQGTLDEQALRALGLSVMNGEVAPYLPPVSLSPEQEKEEALRALLEAVTKKNDKWMTDFITSIIAQVQRGRTLSDKQLKVIRKGFYENRMNALADLFR
jgi:hypothetical protein